MTTFRVPYLSIVYTGCNRGNGGDFSDRFFHVMRSNHEQLTAAGVHYNVLFVEWPAAAPKPLIADLLRAEVPEIGDLLTTIVVDARYHDAFSQNPRIQFNESVARNVAIRRASGSYILCTHPDIYFTRETVALFKQRILRPMVLYLARCLYLKPHLDPSEIDDEVLHDPRNYQRAKMVEPLPFTNTAGEFLLLDRFSWHAIRGFNEVYRVANLHINVSFCLRALASGVLVKDTYANVYRLGPSTMLGPTPSNDHKRDASGLRCSKPMLYDNPASWGLSTAPVTQRSPNDFRLEFDDDAVPPLVSLCGITVPRR